MERLRAGTPIKARGATIIPVLRVTASTLTSGVYGALTPVAVVVVRNGRPSVWEVDGRAAELTPWTAAVPELPSLIAEATAAGA